MKLTVVAWLKCYLIICPAEPKKTTEVPPVGVVAVPAEVPLWHLALALETNWAVREKRPLKKKKVFYSAVLSLAKIVWRQWRKRVSMKHLWNDTDRGKLKNLGKEPVPMPLPPTQIPMCPGLEFNSVLCGDRRWRSWLMHCVTIRKVVGSIPGGVIGIFH